MNNKSESMIKRHAFLLKNSRKTSDFNQGI